MKQKLSIFSSTESILITLILLVAALLRFWDPFNIPFTFDELSALYRTRFDTFGELISQGIMIDGHPAGIQVFLYYWTRLFGNSEFVVKLPFLAAGLASVWFTYRIGKKWADGYTGILAASFIAVLQYFVMYSQIARPYSSGLFFCLWLTNSLTNMVTSETKPGWKAIASVAIPGALCAHNHYFSFFFAIVLACTGFFIIGKEKMKSYLITLLITVALCLPHLPVFIRQFETGGLTRLGPPDFSFFVQWFGFLFHFSPWMIALILVFIPVSLFASIFLYQKYTVNRWTIISVILFVIPAATGYLYSVFGKPVLQQSVLIFSTPFLFIAFFSLFRGLGKKAVAIYCLLILFIGTLSLIKGRQYYTFFYNQGYHAMADHMVSFTDSVKTDVPLIIHGYEPFFLTYYEDKLDKKIPCLLYSLDSLDNFKLRKLLSVQKSEYFAIAHTGVLNLNYYSIIREYFPYVAQSFKGCNYELCIFSRKQHTSKEEVILTENLEQGPALWTFDKEKIMADSTGNHYFVYDSLTEWGPGIEIPLYQLGISRHEILHLGVSACISDTSGSPLLVSVLLTKTGEVADWRAEKFSSFIDTPGKWTNVYLSLRFTDLELQDSMRLQFYIWNQHKKAFLTDNYFLKTEQGNPFIYAKLYDF